MPDREQICELLRGASTVCHSGRFHRYNRYVQAVGVWRSSVARFVRDEEVLGSNPSTPTILLKLGSN